jgi:hypothetical protein
MEMQTLAWECKTEKLSYLENEILKRLCLNINHIVDNQSLLLDLWNDDSPYNLNSLHRYTQIAKTSNSRK